MTRLANMAPRTSSRAKTVSWSKRLRKKTKPTHAHHTGTKSPRKVAAPLRLGWTTRPRPSWATARTNTRSKKTSSHDARRPPSDG